MTYLWGLDTSLSNTGIAIVSLENFQPVYIDSIPTKKHKNINETEDHKLRLKQITDKYDELIKEYPPSVIAMESPFVRHNKSTKAVMKVHGVTQRWFAHLPQFYYAPTTVKAAILYGNANKEALQEKLEKKFKITFKNTDESDALAVAYTYLIEEKKIKRF